MSVSKRQIIIIATKNFFYLLIKPFTVDQQTRMILVGLFVDAPELEYQ